MIKNSLSLPRVRKLFPISIQKRIQRIRQINSSIITMKRIGLIREEIKLRIGNKKQLQYGSNPKTK